MTPTARIAALALALLLAPMAAGAGKPVADPLDEAIALVLAESPQIAQAETALEAVNTGHDWTATVNVGYQTRQFLTSGSGSLEGGQAGPNVGLTVRIPLFDTRQEQEAMKARASIAVTRDAALREFVQAAAELRLLALQQDAAEETMALQTDKLRYFDKQEKAGVIEPAALWPYAEAAKLAEQAANRAALAYAAALETTARKYGGDEWIRLKSLLIRYSGK